MIGRLHVLTDARGGRSPVEVATAALSAGAPVVQVRAKGCTDRELYDLAVRVRALCAEAGADCIIDDRPDVMLAVGAAGTHLGAADLPLREVRGFVRPEHLLGGTAREPLLAASLVADGADYLGVGPVWDTTTKEGLPLPIGPTGIAAVVSCVEVPVIAIGAVTVARVPELLAAGAHGVAVVSAVSDAADPARAVTELLTALGGAWPVPR